MSPSTRSQCACSGQPCWGKPPPNSFAHLLGRLGFQRPTRTKVAAFGTALALALGTSTLPAAATEYTGEGYEYNPTGYSDTYDATANIADYDDIASGSYSYNDEYAQPTETPEYSVTNVTEPSDATEVQVVTASPEIAPARASRAYLQLPAQIVHDGVGNPTVGSVLSLEFDEASLPGGIEITIHWYPEEGGSIESETFTVRPDDVGTYISASAIFHLNGVYFGSADTNNGDGGPVFIDLPPARQPINLWVSAYKYYQTDFFRGQASWNSQNLPAGATFDVVWTVGSNELTSWYGISETYVYFDIPFAYAGQLLTVEVTVRDSNGDVIDVVTSDPKLLSGHVYISRTGSTFSLVFDGWSIPNNLQKSVSWTIAGESEPIGNGLSVQVSPALYDVWLNAEIAVYQGGIEVGRFRPQYFIGDGIGLPITAGLYDGGLLKLNIGDSYSSGGSVPVPMTVSVQWHLDGEPFGKIFTMTYYGLGYGSGPSMWGLGTENYVNSSHIGSWVYAVGSLTFQGRTVSFTTEPIEITEAPDLSVTAVYIYQPNDVVLTAGETHQFKISWVQQTGGADRSVTWSVSGNNDPYTAISSEGLLTVGEKETATSISVIATSNFNSSASDTVAVTVNAAPPAFAGTVEIIGAPEIGRSVYVELNGFDEGEDVWVSWYVFRDGEWDFTYSRYQSYNDFNNQVLWIDWDLAGLPLKAVATNYWAAGHRAESEPVTIAQPAGTVRYTNIEFLVVGEVVEGQRLSLPGEIWRWFAPQAEQLRVSWFDADGTLLQQTSHYISNADGTEWLRGTDPSLLITPALAGSTIHAEVDAFAFNHNPLWGLTTNSVSGSVVVAPQLTFDVDIVTYNDQPIQSGVALTAEIANLNSEHDGFRTFRWFVGDSETPLPNSNNQTVLMNRAWFGQTLRVEVDIEVPGFRNGTNSAQITLPRDPHPFGVSASVVGVSGQSVELNARSDLYGYSWPQDAQFEIQWLIDGRPAGAPVTRAAANSFTVGNVPVSAGQMLAAEITVRIGGQYEVVTTAASLVKGTFQIIGDPVVGAVLSVSRPAWLPENVRIEIVGWYVANSLAGSNPTLPVQSYMFNQAIRVGIQLYDGETYLGNAEATRTLYQLPAVTGVTITTPDQDVQQGTVLNLPLLAEAITVGNPAPVNTVTWSDVELVPGVILAVTEQELRITESAATGTIVLRATSDADPTKYADLTIRIVSDPQVHGVYIETQPHTIVQGAEPLQLVGEANTSGYPEKPSTEVTWSVPAGLPTGVSLTAGGLLTVGENAAGGPIQIVATAVADSTVTASLVITVAYRPQVSGVTITTPAQTVIQGAPALQLVGAADVLGDPAPSTDVTWSVPAGLPAGVSLTAGGLLTVGENAAVGPIVIRATSVADSNEFAEVTITVAYRPQVTGVTITTEAQTLLQGAPALQLVGAATYLGQFATGVNPAEVTWSVPAGLPAGVSLTSGGVLTVGENAEVGPIVIRATSVTDSIEFAEVTITVAYRPQVTGVTITTPAQTVLQGADPLTLVGAASYRGEFATGVNPAAVTWSAPAGLPTGVSLTGSGVLTVGENAGVGPIMIRATSAVDTSQYNTVTITVAYRPLVSAVVVAPTGAIVAQRNTQTFTASVVSQGLTEAQQAVVWSVSPDAFASIDANGVLTVSADQPVGNLAVTATSVFDGTVFGTVNVLVIAAPDVTVTPDEVINLVEDAAQAIENLPASLEDAESEEVQAVIQAVVDATLALASLSETEREALLADQPDLVAALEAAQEAIREIIAAGDDAALTDDAPWYVALVTAPVEGDDADDIKDAVLENSNELENLTVTSVVGIWDFDTTNVVTDEVWEPAAPVRVNLTGFDATGLNPANFRIAWFNSDGSFDQFLEVFHSEDGSMFYFFAPHFSSGALVEFTGPAVYNVTVEPGSVDKVQGDRLAFTAAVDAVSGADETVTWSVTGGDNGTSIDRETGLLVISYQQTPTTLTVTATSVFDDTVTGTAEVNVGEQFRVNTVTVTPSMAALVQGETLTFTATVAAQGGASTGYNWSVTGANNGTAISAAGVLTVSASQTPGTLAVVATAVDPGYDEQPVTGTATVIVTAPAAQADPVVAQAITGIANAIANGSRAQLAAAVQTYFGLTPAQRAELPAELLAALRNATRNAAHGVLGAGADWWVSLESVAIPAGHDHHNSLVSVLNAMSGFDLQGVLGFWDFTAYDLLNGGYWQPGAPIRVYLTGFSFTGDASTLRVALHNDDGTVELLTLHGNNTTGWFFYAPHFSRYAVIQVSVPTSPQHTGDDQQAPTRTHPATGVGFMPMVVAGLAAAAGGTLAVISGRKKSRNN